MSDEVPVPNATDGTPPRGRDAIIYLPGLVQRPGERAIDSVCRRIAASFDRNADDAQATFVLHEGRDEDYGVAQKARVITIARKDAPGEIPVADVFELDYAESLTRGFRQRLPILQALSAAGMVILHWRAFARSVRAKSRSRTQQAQLAYAGLLLMVLAAYAFIVMATAIGTVATLPERAATDSVVVTAAQPVAETDADAAADTTWRDWIPRRWLGTMQAFVIFSTFLGFLVPVDLKGLIERVAGELTPAMGYLSTGARRGVLMGQFADLLEHILEKEADPAVRYDRIHVVGYSFGSLIALDALFQNTAAPSARFGKIGTLVTIGCPFDFVRSYWPRYFEERRCRTEPQRWLNYYVPTDVIASDFLGQSPQQPPRGIGLADGTHRLPDTTARYGPAADMAGYGMLEYATLIGFKAHGHYWERGEDGDAGVFELIVRELYAEEPALA